MLRLAGITLVIAGQVIMAGVALGFRAEEFWADRRK